MIRGAGIRVPLVTVDQPDDAMLAAGGLDGVLRTSLVRLGTARSACAPSASTSRPDR